jgi:hypothetical protein
MRSAREGGEEEAKKDAGGYGERTWRKKGSFGFH